MAGLAVGRFLVFHIIELSLFFLIYVLYSLIAKSFSIADAGVVGVVLISWRVVSGQLLAQLVLVGGVFFFGLQRSILAVLCAINVAFVLAAALWFGEIQSAFKLYRYSALAGIGEGLAISISGVLATMISLRPQVFANSRLNEEP